MEFPDDTDDPFDDDGSQGLGRGNPLPIPDLPTIATQSAQDAFTSVLAGAGASLVRDAVDVRVTNMVATGVVSGTANGIINNPSQVGGYPTIPFVMRDAGFDTDQDGMPNDWEAAHGLNSNNAADRNGDFDSDGFTNLDDYLNDVGRISGRASDQLGRIDEQPLRADRKLGHRVPAVAVRHGRRFNSGTAVVDAVGQHAGTLIIAPNNGNTAQVNITAGRLDANDASRDRRHTNGSRRAQPERRRPAAPRY